MKKGNTINFKKRFAGMLAMMLAMFMLMGNTAMAANYYTYADYLTNVQGGDYGSRVSFGTELQAGDTITCDYIYDSAGIEKANLCIKEEGVIKIEQEIPYNGTYILEDGYSYKYIDVDAVVEDWYGMNFTPPKFYFERTALLEPTPEPTPTPEPIPQPETHSHAYEVNRKDATETEDGWIKLQCKYCGHVKEEGQLSAMTEFWMNSVDKVNKATPGDNVVLESKIWYSMPDYVMEAIAGRRDITVTMKMKYEHKNYEIVISPEEVVQYSDKYYGVLYLSQLYGGNVVE